MEFLTKKDDEPVASHSAHQFFFLHLPLLPRFLLHLYFTLLQLSIGDTTIGTVWSGTKEGTAATCCLTRNERRERCTTIKIKQLLI